jgi:hypothetical protein
MGTQHFSKTFFFPNNKRKTKTLFFFLANGLAHGNHRPTAVFGHSRPHGEGELARLGASAHGRLAQRNREGDSHGHNTPASSASWQRGGRQRPTAIPGHERTRWSAHGFREEMANAGL